MAKKRKKASAPRAKAPRNTKSRPLKPAKNIIAKRTPDGSVAIMHFDNDSAFFTLQSYAAEFWALINGQRSADQIEEILLKKHKLPRAQFHKDVQRLLKDLTKAKLLKA